MTRDSRGAFADDVAKVASDPGFRDFAREGSALLLWDLEGTRLLWASPAAESLRGHITSDDEGHLSSAFPARTHLRALGQGLAPTGGARLERLRFDASRLTAPTTCACRRLTLASGEGALLTAIIGPVPKLAGGARTARQDASPTAQAGEAAPEASNQPVPAGHDGTQGGDGIGRAPHPNTVRFLWRMDADGRFTERSDSLEDVVGSPSAAIIGRTWEEIAGEIVRDLSGGVSGLLSRRETWSGVPTQWRISGTDRGVAVDLAGTPLLGRDHAFLGFRGFGLCRTKDVSEWLSAPPPEQLAETEAEPLGEDGQPAAGAAHDGRDDLTIENNHEMPAEQDAQPPPSEPPPSRTGADKVLALRVVGRGEQSSTPDRSRAEPPGVLKPSGMRQDETRMLPHLSDQERSAFRDIARALGARFVQDERPSRPMESASEVLIVRAREPVQAGGLEVLDNLPIGILVCRGETPLFANRYLLRLSGYEDAGELAREGGLARLFPGRLPEAMPGQDEGGSPVALSTAHAGNLLVEVRTTRLRWEGPTATAFLVRKIPENDPAPRLQALEADLRAREARLSELAAILDTATDGVIVLDAAGRILSLNRSAEALFGYDQREIAGESLTVLLAPESQRAALEHLDGLRSSDVASLLSDGQDVLGRVRQGDTIPLSMTIGRISETPERKFCVVLRDMTGSRKAEAELLAVKRSAEQASAQKSDFLAKVGQEARAPLDAIVGLADAMLDERLGPAGNDRYRDRLRDIREAGRRVIALVGDLLDLTNIESGRRELSFVGVSLNDTVAGSVATLSQQAARERVVIRTSFAPSLPLVVVDERSIRQIVANLVSNAVKFTEAGGQVIVSTAMTDRGEAVIRIRDTGIGMTGEEIEAAFKPFRKLAVARKGKGTGLGLPLTKALVEANRGTLHISSVPAEGTLVEVLFPPTRVLAD